MVTCHPSLAKTLAFATAMIKLVLSLFTVSVSRSAVILYAIKSPLIAASLAAAWFAVLTAIRRQGDHLAAPLTAHFDNVHPTCAPSTGEAFGGFCHLLSSMLSLGLQDNPLVEKSANW